MLSAGLPGTLTLSKGSDRSAVAGEALLGSVGGTMARGGEDF